MKTIIEINGKKYKWVRNYDVYTSPCKLCAGFRDGVVCTASNCDEMPAYYYLEELAQPGSAQNTPSGARRKAGGK